MQVKSRYQIDCDRSMSRGKIRPPNPDLKNIGRRIREIRGFDLTHEKGRIVPTLEMLLKLKAYSGKSIDSIVTGEE